ncbi:ABC transporter ATP-binding protein [Candidatus Bathyarchaeota archaeon]|nr:ABC transporter ATP-binding protein [Candidatus Bathyarchaeota archaeon]
MDLVLRGLNIKGGYEMSKVYVDAVNNVSLELYKNEIFGVAGESGCGKSTLVKILYGYIEPPLKLKSGSIELYSNDEKSFMISSLSLDDLRKTVWWKHISYIPQNSMNVLNPTTRVKDHFAEMYKTYTGMKKKEAYAMARKYVEDFGLPSDALQAFPHQLSGGMRQRIVIAVALLLQPAMVLADEPTSALDVINQRAALMFLKKAQERLKNTIVLVSHDMGIHSVLTDRMGVMYAGNIVEVGGTQAIFEKPLHPYTEALIESLPRLGDKSQRTGLKGQPPDLRQPPSGCRFHPRCPYSKPICQKEEPEHGKREKDRRVSCWIYAS